jgi:hypothetical protein
MRGLIRLPIAALLLHAAEAFLAPLPHGLAPGGGSTRRAARGARACKMAFPSFLPPAEMAEVSVLPRRAHVCACARTAASSAYAVARDTPRDLGTSDWESRYACRSSM